MQKVYTFALIVIIFIISCRSKTIIPKRDMVSLLVKIQILDAAILNSDLKHDNNSNKDDNLDFYSKTIQSFGYTEAQFDSSLRYYASNSKAFDAIYDEVIIELSKIEMKMIAENKVKEDAAIDTLKNLWPLKPLWQVPADGTINPIAFELPVVGEGIYTVSADITIYPDDESVDPSLTAYFFFDDKSEKGNISERIFKKLSKDGIQRNHKIRIELKNSLVTHMKGFILEHHNSNAEFKKHASASNIKITYTPFPKSKRIIKAKHSLRPIE